MSALEDIKTSRRPALVRVDAPNVHYSERYIEAEYEHHETLAVRGTDDESTRLVPRRHAMRFRTERHVPKVGVMLVGWGGNNGTTVTGGILANQHNITWNTKEGVQNANYFGSLTQASTVDVGSDQSVDRVHVPFASLLPMVHPNDLVVGGWDISSMPIADAMGRAQVFDYDLQRQLAPLMRGMKPLPSVYYPDFIAANQSDRADNIVPGKDKREHLEHLRSDIRAFREQNALDKVIVVWTANTERFCDVVDGVHDTADHVMRAISESHAEISPSTLFAVAAILEGCSYINGSPQNTFVPGVVELAREHGVFIAGDDFKSGQTKLKSVLVDFLVSSGIKPASIVSYNHLGNNDGRNLSAPQQFRSKEISKSNVVDDMVASNHILYGPNEHPDHTVVIKYVPFVKDSKRAIDEYISHIFMGGRNTIAIHNTCEDSLLAAPLIIDLVVLTELMERIQYKTSDAHDWASFDAILSILSFLLKAPLVRNGTPVVNALMKQRACIVNILRACLGLQPENHMLLTEKMST